MSGEAVVRYKDCKVAQDGELVRGDVWARGGKIIDPLSLFFRERKPPDTTVNCRGLVAAPGFIDIQVNGALGIDFSSFSSPFEAEEGLSRIADQFLQHGVTGFCPTLVTSPPEYYQKILPAMKPRLGDKNGAAILGVHLEGPFISAEKRGAHKQDYTQDKMSVSALLNTYQSLENVRIITLAPELDGAMEVIQWLKEQGIVVSLGHSMASLRVAEEAVSNGASLITHLFNAMLPFHHRDPGIVGLLTSLKVIDKQIYYGMIADGWHTHETVQRIAFKAHSKGAVLVTDAMAAMGLCEGRHQLGDMVVEVKGRRTSIAGTDRLAGSVATMKDCVQEFHNATACGMVAALKCASLHPALSIGATNKGHFTVGADADIAFLSYQQKDPHTIQDLEVCATVIAGEIVWNSKDSPLENIDL